MGLVLSFGFEVLVLGGSVVWIRGVLRNWCWGCFLVCFSCKLGCLRWLGFSCLDSLGVGFRHVSLCVLDGLCFYVFRLSRRFSDFLVWVVGMV